MPPSRPRAIWALVALVAGAALAVDALTVVPLDATQHQTWLWFGLLVVGFFLAQTSLVRVRVGPHGIGFSLMEFPLVLGLYLCSPQLLVIARVLGGGASLAWKRQPLQKALFNCALFTLETAGAVVIWHAVLGSGDELGPRGWLATGLALLYTSLLSAILVAAAIKLASGTRPRLLESFGPRKLGEFGSACAAMVAVCVISTEARAVWLICVLAALVWVAHRSYDQAHRRAESLEQVSRFTEAVGREVVLDAVVEQVLLGVRSAVQARVAELRLNCGDDNSGDWVLLDDDTVARRPAPLLTVVCGHSDQATLLGADHVGGRELAERGYRYGMLVPLRSEGRAVGCLVVADAVGDSETFGDQDLRQLQALANHAAVAIDNAQRADLILRQAAEREHAALHDELTGLPNRRLFGSQADEALAERPGSVLLVDFDNLRAVNDALGHQVGDRLLVLIARRIQESAPADAVVARVGGDEFAVLLPGADDAAARACAGSVRDGLTLPFDLEELLVAVVASVGVVVADRRADAATVLRHADLALRSAQETRSGIEVFHPGLDRHDSSRLGLLAELRSTIAAEGLRVHYQPQIDLATGQVVGVEALARWEHPTLGGIAPDEFVPLAEHSGLITSLTMLVLRTALRDTERLQTKPGELRIAVNISPRSLLDRGFVDEVARTLAEVSVPASALTLEITETSLMTEPERAVEALQRLRSAGIRLSVDDLGTGYSSLAYLLTLPVDELKIDRSFVTSLPDPDAEAVVGAIIDLGHRLGRDVVAEGIEHAGAYDVLRGLGCDLAQGYWMGRPMPLVELEAYLDDRRPTRVGGARPSL